MTEINFGGIVLTIGGTVVYADPPVTPGSPPLPDRPTASPIPHGDLAEQIAGLPSRGGALRLPAGDYALSETLVIDRPLALLGDGSGLTRLVSSASPALLVTQAQGPGTMRFRDFTLACAPAGVGIAVDLETEVSRGLFADLEIVGGARSIDVRRNAINYTVRGCYLAASDRILSMENATSTDRGDNVVTGNMLFGGGPETVGIRVGAAGLRASDNKIMPCAIGFDMLAGEGELANNTVVAIANPRAVAIRFPNSGAGRDFAITGGSLHFYGLGVLMRGDTIGSWAAGTIHGVSFRPLSGEGYVADLDGCQWINVTGCIAQGSSGVKIGPNTYRVQESGNVWR